MYCSQFWVKSPWLVKLEGRGTYSVLVTVHKWGSQQYTYIQFLVCPYFVCFICILSFVPVIEPMVQSCPFHAFNSVLMWWSWIWLMTKIYFFFHYLVSQILISARGLIRILSKSTLQTHFLLMNGSLTLAFTQSLHPLILSGCMFMTGKFSSGNYTIINYYMSYNWI